ncbi:MAG: hypothetical protein AAGE85_18270 [Pseudomonadota bacterium]
MNYFLWIAIWLVAGGLGLYTYTAVESAFGAGRYLQILWLVCTAASVAIGLVATRLAQGIAPLSSQHSAMLKLGVGWTIASAAGWYFSVSVGSVFGGVVTGLVALSLFDQRIRSFLIVAVAGLLGARIGLEAPGTSNLLVGAAVCGIAAIGACAIAIVVTRGDKQVLPMFAATVAAWGLAWALAFLSKRIVTVPDLFGYGTNAAELVFAFVIGGALSPIGTGIVRKALAWGAGGILAAAVSVAIDLGVSAATGGEVSRMDIGQSLGMGIGAALAYVLLVRENRRPATEAAGVT